MDNPFSLSGLGSLSGSLTSNFAYDSKGESKVLVFSIDLGNDQKEDIVINEFDDPDVLA